MKEDERPGIRALPLFRHVTEQTFDALMSAARSQDFPARLDLLRQGDRPDFLHVVVEGAVELLAEWQGRSAVMAVVRPVSTFILAACIADAPCLMSAHTLERSRIVMVPAGALRAAVPRDPGLAAAVMSELAQGYRSMVRQTKNLKLRTGRERLAAWFLRQGRRMGDPDSYALPVEKRHLASYLGMTPESLSRTLRLLQRDGVRLEGSRVIFTDRDRLRAVARPDPLIDDPDSGSETDEAALPLPQRRG